MRYSVLIFLLLLPSTAVAQKFKVTSFEQNKPYAEVTSEKYPDYKCTYRLSKNQYIHRCVDKARNIDFAVEIQYRFTACSHTGMPAICLYFDKATARGPNGNNTWLGGNISISTTYGGSTRIWIPSGGFLSTRSHDIRPKSPVVFRYKHARYGPKKSRITMSFPGKLEQVRHITGFVNAKPVAGQLAERMIELAKGPEIEEQEQVSDCLELRRKLNRLLSNLKLEERNYDKKFAQFKAFFESTKVELHTEYAATNWSVSTPIPFLGDIGIEKPATVTGGQDYLPNIVIKNPASRRSKLIALMEEVEKIPPLTDKVGKLKTAYQMLTASSLSYYEGIKRHKRYMQRRSATLERYSRSLTEYYCKNVLALKSEILVLRDRELEQSQCNPMEKQVFKTDVTRSSDIRNSEHLIRAEDFCRSFLEGETSSSQMKKATSNPALTSRIKEKRSNPAPPKKNKRVEDMTEEERLKATQQEMLQMYQRSTRSR